MAKQRPSSDNNLDVDLAKYTKGEANFVHELNQDVGRINFLAKEIRWIKSQLNNESEGNVIVLALDANGELALFTTTGSVQLLSESNWDDPGDL